MCHLRTWFRGKYGDAALRIGLDDVRNLFQMILFYNSRIAATRVEVTPSSLATGSQSFHLSLPSPSRQWLSSQCHLFPTNMSSLFSFLLPKRAKPKLSPAIKQETNSVGLILGQNSPSTTGS